MKKGFPKLKSDTWAIITAFGGWSAVIVTVMLALNAATNARMSEHVDRLDARIGEQSARIDAQGTRIDMLQDTMRNEHTAMRNEHALILESLAGVAQRVSYIEGHLGVGRAADPEPAGPPQG